MQTVEPSGFPVTRWSLVLTAGDSHSSAAVQALEDLCQLYWKPVYGYIRASRRSRDDALDLTQGFFGHLLEKKVFQRAHAGRGRFRSYILGCLKKYLCEEQRHAAARKRGGDWSRVDYGVEDVEEWLGIAARAKDRPDRVYDYACAVSLMNEALKLIEEEYGAKGRSRAFAALKPYLQGDTAAPDYALTARTLGTTPGTIGVLVHRARARYRGLLRSVVAQTLTDPLAVDEELRSLKAALELR